MTDGGVGGPPHDRLRNGDDLLLRNVRPWARTPGGPAVDVLIRNGRIAAIGHDLAVDGRPVADGRGGVLLPALADVHAHLDSTLLGLPFRPHSAAPGLAGLVGNDRANWRSAADDVATRATRTLGATIASGATLVRSHAQVDTDSGLERLDGVLAARQAHSARCDVQVVAFPQAGIIRDPGTADLLGAAIDAGADLIGGIDPCAFDRDPVEHLDTVFGLAERHSVGVDIHLHEGGELGAFTFELIAARVTALAMQGRVTISHAFALSSVDEARQGALIELLAANDIAVTTIAPGNREPLPLDRLRAAGV
ncbi:MAG: amidohydrolase family protein, partial [Ilumatobacteraceae bacterium]